MNLVYYPDPILTSPNTVIEVFDKELDNTLEQMYSIMVANKGIGLAFPQTGINKTAFIIKMKDNYQEFINPKILSTDGEIVMEEGCLSFSGIFIPVKRADNITISAQYRTGEEFKAVLEGMEARVFQHEFEHLSGETFIKHLNRQQRRAVIKHMEKLKR